MLTEKPTSSQTADPDILHVAKNSLERLATWLDNAPEVSLDPFDIKAHPWFARRLKRLPRRIDRLALNAAYLPAFLTPRITRRLLGVPRLQTCGAAAWMSRGYLAVYRLSKNRSDLCKAASWLNRLRALRLENGCWGLPFNWQTSSKLFLANTANLHATQLSSRALTEYFIASGDATSLGDAISACDAFLSVAERLVDSRDLLCLSYAPGDHMQVLNINALAGGWLCRIGQFKGREDLQSYGKRMLNWVARNQLEDGRWEYFSRDSRPAGSVVDHYHTAMVLQGLLEGTEIFSDCWASSLERGVRYYLELLFDDRGRPKMFADAVYPLDIMSCAEGLLFLTHLQRPEVSLPSRLLETANEKLNLLVTWACKHFQTSSGAFYYREYPLYRMRFDSYRWGQGPMLRALADFCIGLDNSEDKSFASTELGAHLLSMGRQ